MDFAKDPVRPGAPQFSEQMKVGFEVARNSGGLPAGVSEADARQIWEQGFAACEAAARSVAANTDDLPHLSPDMLAGLEAWPWSWVKASGGADTATDSMTLKSILTGRTILTTQVPAGCASDGAGRPHPDAQLGEAGEQTLSAALRIIAQAPWLLSVALGQQQLISALRMQVASTEAAARSATDAESSGSSETAAMAMARKMTGLREKLEHALVPGALNSLDTIKRVIDGFGQDLAQICALQSSSARELVLVNQRAMMIESKCMAMTELVTQAQQRADRLEQHGQRQQQHTLAMLQMLLEMTQMQQSMGEIMLQSGVDLEHLPQTKQLLAAWCDLQPRLSEVVQASLSLTQG